MATGIESIETALLNVRTQIAAISSVTAPGYGLDGQNVDMGKHLLDLLAAEEKLVERLITAQGSGFEVTILGRP